MQGRIWLSKLRELKGFTHENVAHLSGIKRAYYTQIENGNRNPSVVVAKRIAAALGFDWTIFFEDECSEKRQSKIIEEVI